MNTKTLNSLCTSNVIKCTFKNAGKYAVQEIAIQGVNMAVNKCIDATVQTALKRAFQQKFKDSVSSALKKNQNFVNSLRKFIYATVPKTALEVRPGDYKIDQDLEMKIKDNVTMKMNMIMSNLLSNCQEVHQIVNTLSRVWDRAVQEFPKHISHSAHKYIKGLLTTTGYCTQIYELYSSIPTETTINSNFVPAFLKTMSEESSVKTWDEDEKPTLEDVERLTCELTDFLSEGVSQAMIDQFSGTATSVFTATFSQKLNSVTGTVVGNLLRRHETQGFFDNQQHYYNVKSAKERTEESLSETERNQTKAYAAKIADEQSQATALELHVLTQSNLLEGKGICVTVVDAQGKCLTEEIYPGADKEAGTIKLVLTKTQQEPQETEGFLNKLKGRLIGKTIPHSGHFDIIRPDGSREMVHSESQDCLFHAVIQATTNGDPDFVKQKATELRSKVGEEIRSKPGKYVKAVKIQTMFNATDRHSKFKIEGGGRSPEKINLYKETIKNLTQEGIIEGYQLGNVGVHEELLGKEKRSQGITEADHIPPKSTFTEAFDQLRKDKMKAAELKRKNEKLYDLIMNTKNDQNGKQQLCMNVLCFDHICALSSGNSRESRACRSLVSEALTNGDIEQAMKCSLIMAHPQSSDNIRNQLEIHRNSKPKNSGLSVESRNQYYQTGFRDMVIAYKEKGIIDQNQTTRLLKWVEENKYVNNNTPEYKDLIAKIEKAKHK
ncbi:uncharacterized protein [Salminus brasiliensis]|uniref:uncharacterized protein n=1 Tax=Salminus brasiliensis TaxID=930266 RepID=UPI003B836F5D